MLAYLSRYTHRTAIGNERIRHYGLLANPNAVKLAQAKAALHMPAGHRAVQDSAQDFMARVAKVNIRQCPACAHGRLRVVQTLAGLKRLPDPWGQAQIQAPTQATTGRPAANSQAPPGSCAP